MTALSTDEIKTLTQYIYALCGVSLDASKAYLLETRLRPLLQKYACRSYMELHSRAKADRSGNLEKEIVDAITTNETLFFRDTAPFEMFKHKIIPDLVDARSKVIKGRPIPLRIWSAACSTGQEVYSIAIALRETLGNLSNFQISILGTDISDDAVAKASYGQYNRFEIERGLPQAVLNKYFTRQGDGWKVHDELRAMATFKKFNLMKPFAGLGRFDVVFCRNVAIYFTAPDKRMVFEKIGSILEPDGALLIGSTESLNGVTPFFEPKRYMRSIFYQVAPRGAAKAAAWQVSSPSSASTSNPGRPLSNAASSTTSRVSSVPPKAAPVLTPARVSTPASPPASEPARVSTPASPPASEPPVQETAPETPHPAQHVRHAAQPLRRRPTDNGPLVGKHAGSKADLKRLLLEKKKKQASA